MEQNMKSVKKEEKQFAVITGASQGLGKALAIELARQKINLILVSLPDQELNKIARQIAFDFQVETHCYETDLSDTENVLELTKWINTNFSVFILINNAGIGGSKRFTDVNFLYIFKILQVNVIATSILTHQLLPNLMDQEQAYVLTVSSMAAFSPIGYKTVYPASKSFIHSFSRGLCEELKGTNVFVSVVNPGAMKTNAEVTKRIEKQGVLGRLTLLAPEKVARYCIRQLFRKDSVIMVNSVSRVILQLIPIWIKLPLMTRAVKRELKTVESPARWNFSFPEDYEKVLKGK
jgi:short-subunit dehydrogenase